MSMEKSSLMVMSNFVGGRCGWVLMPRMALRDVVWMFNARSATMLWIVDHTYRDPHFSNQVVIFVGSIQVDYLNSEVLIKNWR